MQMHIEERKSESVTRVSQIDVRLRLLNKFHEISTATLATNRERFSVLTLP